MGLLDSFLTQGGTPPNPDASWAQALSSPLGQGLLSAAFGYAANAGRGTPLNNIGRGGMAGLLGYGQAQERDARMAEEAQQRQVRSMQLKQMQTQLADQEQARTTAAQFYTPATPAAGGMLDSALPPEFQTGAVPVPAKPARFDVAGYANARMAQNPLEGMKLLAELQKEKPINKLDAKDFTPASVQKFAQTGNYGDLVRLDKLEFKDTGGNLVGLNPFTGQQISTTPMTGNPFKDLVISDGRGGVMPNTPLVTVKKEISKAGAPSMTAINNVHAFEPFANKLQGTMAETLVKNYDALSTAPQTIAALNKAKSLVGTASPFVGSGGDTKLAVAKFFNSNLGTNINANAIKDAETMQSALFSSVMENLKKMDASPSQEQQRQMQNAFGRLTTDPKALPEIIDFWKSQVAGKVSEHNRRVQQAQNGPARVQFPYNITVDLPQDEPAAAPVAPGAPQATMRWNPQTNKLEPVR